MKQILKLSLLLTLLLPAIAHAHNFEVDGIYYLKNGNEATVTYKGTSSDQYPDEYTGEVEIPKTVTYYGTTYSVTAIDYYAFKGCTSLTSVTIPNSVTSIGSSAFSGCSNLNKVNITDVAAWCKINFNGGYSSNPLYIAHRLFLNGVEVSDLTIPSSVTAIGSSAFERCTSLTTVTIPNTVKVIGSSAFSNCTNLTKATIPNSVTFIGSSAFTGCRGLTGITIGNSVETIEGYAFSGCSGLTNVAIPNSVTTIGAGAFSGCTELTRVIIGNSVTSIGSSVFSNCNSLTSITVVSENPTFDSRGNCNAIIETATNTLVAGCKNTIIPNSVTNIGNSAFYNCTSLASVTIPSSVINIGNSAFSGCASLTNVTIPNSVTNIGNSAFYGCTKLNNVTIPNSVANIGDRAFSKCSSLTDITFPNSISHIGSYVFSLTPWYENQPDGLVYIGLIAYNYKGTMPDNTTITIREGTICIAGSAFYGCNGMSKVVIPNTVITIGSSAFHNCTNLTSVMIPDSVSTIGTSAFAGCTGLTSIAIPNSVTSIGSYAFDGCSGITSVTIPNSITTIEEGTFIYCTSLSAVTIPNSVTTIRSSAFDNCSSLTSIVIPNSVTEIEDYSFFECEGLTTVTFQHTGPVRISNGSAFSYCPIKSVYVSDLSFWCMNDFDVFVYPSDYDNIDNHIFLNGVEVTNVIIPNNVNQIADYAFFGCKSLTSLIIPNSVTTIGSNAFQECTGLKSISIPSSVTEIGGMAFYNCIGLSDVYCYILDPTLIIGPNEPLYWDWYEIENVPSRRTLHVPAGSKELYKSDWDWSEAFFGTIVEMDSHLEMPDTSLLYWETVTIPVVLCNDRNILAFQTDIVLPEGFSIVADEEDEYLITPSNRLSGDHVMMASDYENGVVRVVCYTPESQPIEGYNGDLFYITVKVPENAVGEYPIILRNSRLTTEDYTELRIPDASATINVKAYILGDANNSRSVTVTDIVVTAQYVLGRNPQPFIYDAADMNGDGDVSVTDIMLIAYMLQHPSLNAPLRVPAQTANNDRMSADAISLIPGETRTINIMLDNDLDYSAFQLDLTLPEGLTASNFALTDRAGGHAFDVSAIDDSKLRALCYSPELETINGHEGALLTFDVTAMAQVTGNIIVDAIELVTDGCQTVEMGAFNIQVNNSSAVNEVVNGKAVARVEYFNVAGQQIAMPTSGITIIVTTYTDGTRSTTKLHL